MRMSNVCLEIDIGSQSLRLLDGDELVREYPVSTAANGAGELMDSECTPRGRHRIDEKFGDGCVANTVFIGRRATGEIYNADLHQRYPARDWILTRILWLSGLDAGHNQGGQVDSKARYIYIHGTPDETDMSRPGSRGCVRMRNADIIDLFPRVNVGTLVYITE